MPEGAEGHRICVPAGETRSFGEIVFSSPGVYIYEVNRRNNPKGVTARDSSVYRVTVVVRSDGEVQQVIETDGEKAFRDLETAAVKTLGNQDGRILSCGGGAVLRPENVEALKKNGVIVLLTAEPETVYGRVKNGQDRPVLKGRMSVEGISELMEKRRPAYESAASFSVATDGRTPREIAEEIAQKAEWVCGKDNLWNTD